MQKLIKELLDLLDKESKKSNYLIESFILSNKSLSGKLIIEILEKKYNLSSNKLSFLNSQALPYIQDEDYLDVLKKILFHENSSTELKFLIIQKIGWRGKYAKSLIPELQRFLEKKDLKGITSIALAELDWEKKEILIPNLIEILSTEPEYIIRMSAVRQLINYITLDPSITKSLIKVIVNDTSFQVRQKIIHYLGELNSIEAIPVLENVIKFDKHTLVRSVATRVLSELKK